MRFLFRLNATFSPPQELGETPAGTRRILLSEAGEFHGPGLNGEVLVGGGDWVLIRQDGVAELDIRLTLKTDNNALIYATRAFPVTTAS